MGRDVNPESTSLGTTRLNKNVSSEGKLRSVSLIIYVKMPLYFMFFLWKYNTLLMFYGVLHAKVIELNKNMAIYLIKHLS